MKTPNKPKKGEWNRQRVHLLGVDGHDYQSQIEILKQAGLEVEFAISIQELYQSLCSGSPGAVLISSCFEGPAGMSAPDFVHRRFGVPVVLFTETPDKPVSKDWEMSTIPDEIVIVDSNKTENIVSTLSNWEQSVSDMQARRLARKAAVNSTPASFDFRSLLEDMERLVESPKDSPLAKAQNLYSA